MRAEAEFDEDRLGLEADRVYAALLKAHEGLTAEASAALNARLILLLMHQVGRPEPILAAIAAAQAT